MAFSLRKLAKLGVWVIKHKLNPHIVHGNYDITSRCTFKCEHCYFYRSYGEDQGKHDLTDKQWLQKFKNDYKRGIRFAYLTGGEPGLRQKVIKYADKIFDLVVIFSNGTIKIDPSIKRSIFVSLDGPREIHTKIRGADLWESIINNTKNDKRVLFTCTLSTTNDKYIEKIYEIAKRQNVCGLMFGFYTSHRSDFKNDPLYLHGKRREEALQKLKKLIKKDPEYIFVTDRMIDVYRDHRHKNSCPFYVGRGSVVSYYPNGKPKSKCVVGGKANCASCGCPQPVAVYCALRYDWRAIKLGEKFLSIQFREKKYL